MNNKNKYQRLKVIMLQLEYFPLFSGHAVYLQHLIKKLNLLKCETVVLSGDFSYLPKYDKIDGIEVFRIPFAHDERWWELKLSGRILKFLYKNRKNYNVLHINGILDFYGVITIFNRLFRKNTITQMVLFGSDDPITQINTYKLMRLRYIVLTALGYFTCISKRIEKSYLDAKLTPKKISYIKQGVDIEKFKPVKDKNEKEMIKIKLGLQDCPKIVIFIGAVVKRKGVDLLVRSWKKVQQNNPSVCLVILGQDSFNDTDSNKIELNKFVENIKNEVYQNQLRVKFLGIKYNVNEYLKCADIFVLPSRKEGFGNVIIEAMASGLPAIVTYMDGVAKETIENGLNGYIVYNTDQLSESINHLLSNGSLSKKMGLSGRIRAIQEFSLDSIAKQYVFQYRRML